MKEQHYNNLKDQTSKLYQRASKNKIDSLNDIVDGENNRIKWDEIKNDIEMHMQKERLLSSIIIS